MSDEFYPEHFDPAIYLGVDGGALNDGSSWDYWCAGNESFFPQNLAQFHWWHLADALDTYVTWDGIWPKEYFGCCEIAVARFRKELTKSFQAVVELLGCEAWQSQPFRLESRMVGVECDDKFQIQTMCAYAVLCLDAGINGLMHKNPLKAATGFGYSIRALDLAHEYRRNKLKLTEVTLAEKRARTQMAKSGAIARLANDPRQQEKFFVRDCWQSWRKNPTQYKSKAAFARDMIDKCEHLTSQKKIEDWCREWEAEN